MHGWMKRNLRHWINLWPPFLATGIRVTRWDADSRAVDVELRPHFWSMNYVGTHYGGSLYSMVDPFYMLILIANLGREYIVWDKAATIRFRRATKECVKAEFRITEQQLDDIRQSLTMQEKVEPVLTVDVRDSAGVVAEVEKVIYIRRKPV